MWTFTSEHEAASENSKPLPLMAIRFAPDLDDHNRARAGYPLVIPVLVQQQRDSAHGSPRSLRVEVSYDGGKTWRRTPLLGSGLKRFALVAHLAGAAFVSLRVTAADSLDNTLSRVSSSSNWVSPVVVKCVQASPQQGVQRS